jgi:hypothetical protein
MGDKKKAISRQQVAKIQPFRLQDAGAKVLNVYSNLTDAERRSVEVVLERHAFLLHGTNSYLWWGKWNESDRRGVYFQLLDTVSEEAANAWLDWAHEISVGGPSRATCTEAILGLMGELVRLKFLESPSATTHLSTTRTSVSRTGC